MKQVLKDLLADYFQSQAMPGFVLTFEPPRKGRRRSKRVDVAVEVSGKMPAPLGGKKTARDVIATLIGLSNDLQEWTNAGYKAVLTDPLGDLVAPDDKLEELRQREEVRKKEDKADAEKVLTKALKTCEKYLGEEGLPDLVMQVMWLLYAIELTPPKPASNGSQAGRRR